MCGGVRLPFRRSTGGLCPAEVDLDTRTGGPRTVIDEAGDGEVLTLLLLGSDEGPPRSGQVDAGNADGFQVVETAADGITQMNGE